MNCHPGIWSYEARLHHTVSNGAIVSVEVFGIEARSKSGIKVRAWASHGEAEKAAKAGPNFRPVKIFAEVTQDRLPVQGAKVRSKDVILLHLLCRFCDLSHQMSNQCNMN